MKLLLCHNHYQLPGGEDAIFATEVELLRRRGHEVVTYTVHNDTLRRMRAVHAAARSLWSQESHDQVRALIRTHQPELVHFYNTFPLLSPSVYFAAKAEDRPVVQSLHNYRLLCPNGLFYRDEHVCEDCLGKAVPWPAVAHACYRDDRAASATVATMLTTHRLARSWRRCVDVYMAGLSEFARPKFATVGIEDEQLVLKPNFIPDPGPGDGSGGFAVFIARLDAQKGTEILLRAWAELGGRIPLKVIGDGPLASAVEGAASRDRSIEWLGRQPPDHVLAHLKRAALCICASRSYEGQPRTIVESLAVGTPVLAPRLGAMRDMIREAEYGALFEPADPRALAARTRELFATPSRLQEMREPARRTYLAKYTEDISHDIMLDVYEKAKRRHAQRTRWSL